MNNNDYNNLNNLVNNNNGFINNDELNRLVRHPLENRVHRAIFVNDFLNHDQGVLQNLQQNIDLFLPPLQPIDMNINFSFFNRKEGDA